MMMDTRTMKTMGLIALVALMAVGATAAAKIGAKPGSETAQENQVPPRPVQTKSAAKPDRDIANRLRQFEQRPEAATVPDEGPLILPATVDGDITLTATADSASYILDAILLSTGAAIGDSSESYVLDWTAGELAVGEGESPSYTMSVGFLPTCSCPFQSDFDEDGFLTALDLATMIDILFAGLPDVSDPDCPNPRADFDCDKFSTALDLGNLIDHLFAGGDGPCDPCGQ